MMLTRLRLIAESIRHYWRIQLAVAAATAIGVAVLAGSLLVGASVQESLRALVIERLGPVEKVLATDVFFRQELEMEMQQEQTGFESVATILERGAASSPDTGAIAGDVNVIGVDEALWSFFGRDDLKDVMSAFGVIINQPLADELGIEEGGEILIRVQKPGVVGQESLLGERDDVAVTMRLDVEKILPQEGIGRFSLEPTQRSAKNVYVALERLQGSIEREERANTILIAAAGDNTVDPQSSIQKHWQLDDVGLHLDKVQYSDAMTYLSLETRRIYIEPMQMLAARKTAETMGLEAYPTLTYIVNTTRVGDAAIPYSTITGLDEIAPGVKGPEPGKIFLNAWAADDMGAEPGDKVGLTYFVTDPMGNLFEETTTLTLSQIVPMDTPWLDADLTPEFPGLSDADSMGQWDAPFPVDLDRIRDEDDKYWEMYRATPKAFVSLQDAKRLWANRYGDFSALRIFPKSTANADKVKAEFLAKMRENLSAADAGLAVMPVRERGLAASKGSSDFGGLFVGFSLFLLLSAAMLVQILYRIGVMSRSSEIGLLRAVGFSKTDVRRLYLTEGAIVALVGSLVGGAMGAAYAAVMTYGLNTWWVGSIGSPFVRLSLSPAAIVGGIAGGWFIAMISIYIAMRKLSKLSPALLISGERETEATEKKRGIVAPAITLLALLGGIGLLIAGQMVSAHMQAGLFFAAAGCFLAACLAGFYVWLRRGADTRPEHFALSRVAAQSVSRDPGRSLLVAGLMASATFLIVAVGANRHDPSGSLERDSGTGGYELMAESATPLPGELKKVLKDRGWTQPDLAAIESYSFRLRPGGDASCMNLYQVAEPRVLAAPASFIDRGGFVFTASLADSPEAEANPWLVLRAEDAEATPAIADYTTAYWLLKVGMGKTLDVGGTPLRMAGFLRKSILQSELIAEQERFEKAYPDISGWAFFLIDTPDGKAQEYSQRIESDLSDFGFDAVSTVEHLEELSKVENTYLATFQSLGGLGLLLGTFGLAFVLLRNILERRRELAMLRALGFRRSTLVWLTAGENILLLIVGLGSGIVCALLALTPVLLQRSVQPDWTGLAIVLAAAFAVGVLATLTCASLAIRGELLNALRND